MSSDAFQYFKESIKKYISSLNDDKVIELASNIVKTYDFNSAISANPFIEVVLSNYSSIQLNDEQKNKFYSGLANIVKNIRSTDFKTLSKMITGEEIELGKEFEQNGLESTIETSSPQDAVIKEYFNSFSNRAKNNDSKIFSEVIEHIKNGGTKKNFLNIYNKKRENKDHYTITEFFTVWKLLSAYKFIIPNKGAGTAEGENKWKN